MREDKVKEHTFQTVPAYLEILKIVRPMIKYGKENSLELHPIFFTDQSFTGEDPIHRQGGIPLGAYF